jgi:hypothetical protein
MGHDNDSGVVATGLFSGSFVETFGVRNTSSSGASLHAHSAGGIGVTALSDSSTGIQAEAHANDQISIHGTKVAGTGPAVQGENSVAGNGYAAVYGLTNGSGPGTFGENTVNGNGSSGVARGTGAGVYGQSDNGLGGRFKGKKAQIRLEPSTTTTHPASGDAGEIFLDKSKRLWLCKGGTTWVRIV